MMPKTLQRFGRDERGNFALTFACSVTVLVGVAGAAMDFSMASTAEKRSQQLADVIALNGAIYVKNNDSIPASRDEDGGLPPGSYTATDLGFDYSDFVKDGGDGVTVDVEYNDTNKEVRVKVSGETNTTLTRVMGKEHLDFSADATVSYMEIEDATPASIALVLDNSGSMGFDDKIAEDQVERSSPVAYWGRGTSNNGCASDENQWGSICVKYEYTAGKSPADAQARMVGLKSSVKSFSNTLKKRMEGAGDGRDYIRMGMITYSNVQTPSSVNMHHGYLSDGQVDAMQPSGSTNSSPPMKTMKEWMSKESAAHKTHAQGKNLKYIKPLKFVVLMSDGENTVGTFKWKPNNKASTWYDISSGNPTTIMRSLVYNNKYKKNPSDYPNHQRGSYQRETDVETIKACRVMRNRHKVEIFTIGFALDEGHYVSNTSNPEATYELDDWRARTARHMLRQCASSKDHFIAASDSEELQAAFDQIQNAIAEELIRIKS